MNRSSRSIGTGGRDVSVSVVTILGMRTEFAFPRFVDVSGKVATLDLAERADAAGLGQ